ncbi:MAG: phenylalanine--tRNA ligase subunit alpha [Nanoarchaeota archaeon]|nr:phenylalanine--tRNA ligase subunit alpha [Nanoarchaeota archaeon]
MEDIKKIAEYLSPNEKRILPFIKEKDIQEICRKSALDKVAVLRALEYLQNKKIVILNTKKEKIVEIGVNGALYKRKGLPERRLLNLLDTKKIISLEEAQKQSKLSDDEFKASIGALKKKAFIELKNGKIILNTTKEEISRKSLEESFIEYLPLNIASLTPEQKFALDSLKNRRDIIDTREESIIEIEITELGKKILKQDLNIEDLIESLTPEILKKGVWKSKKFRRYNVTSQVPEINGGKRHFVNQASDYARKIWTEMGFKEMNGNLLQSSFWNFDALFTAQDHPVREMQDTFFINKKTELPASKIVKAVKQSHEKGVNGSKGWQYSWNEEEAKRLVLRTHTTCLSAQTLAKLGEAGLKELPAKFFAVGKCFRNETIDWGHGFEFNQTEGIVVDENANFKHLIGYLKEFAKKMGFEKVRFRPAYFPYTEPSLEGDVWNEEKQKWMEVFGAGIFRPEVTEPLLGKPIPVLAWGPGFDRMIMRIYNIQDLREFYKNDLSLLRKIKFWIK